jgi:hypothetical protein
MFASTLLEQVVDRKGGLILVGSLQASPLVLMEIEVVN